MTALRSFEVAGRLGSFTLAAGELFVSQAAISRQIRDLETTLGSPLFARRHRGVDLTPAGARLLEVLTRSFGDIRSCLSGIAARPAAQRCVSVSNPRSLPAGWWSGCRISSGCIPRSICRSSRISCRVPQRRGRACHSPQCPAQDLAEIREPPSRRYGHGGGHGDHAVRDAAGPIRQLGDLKAHVLLLRRTAMSGAAGSRR